MSRSRTRRHCRRNGQGNYQKLTGAWFECNNERVNDPVENADRPARVRLAAADKNELVLRGLRGLVAETSDLELVVTATDAERFIEVAKSHTFDVGIVGWIMPAGGGRGILDALSHLPTPPRIVVYTGDPDADLPGLTMSLGAAAFCSKSDPTARLLEAIRTVADGRMVFPFVDARRAPVDPLGILTRREQELLITLADGRTNAEIARELGLSVNTVKFHLRNLYDKLQVRNRSEATALHWSQGSGRKPD